jgi:hypothetical protein
LRVAQERTPVGCFWAIAAFWGLLAYFERMPGFLDIAIVIVIVALAIYFTIDSLVFKESYLDFPSPPEAGRTFHATIVTPLKNDDELCTVRLLLYRRGGRRAPLLWSAKAEWPVRPTGHGFAVPFEYAIPAEVADKMASGAIWRVSAKAMRAVPIPYFASFAIPVDPAPQLPRPPLAL